MTKILLIGFGGAAGSIMRYLSAQLIMKLHGGTFPAGTMVVNIVGCFLIGVVYKIFGTSDSRWFLLAVGFCGGFTTFSSFALENFHMLTTQNYVHAILYTIISVVAGFLAIAAGMLATYHILRY